MSSTLELPLDLRTDSQLAEAESGPETRGRDTRDDWWLPAPSRLPDKYTGSVSTDEVPLEETASVVPMTATQPKKKSDVGIRLKTDRKVLLQHWECVVLEKDDEVVCCEMYDLTDESKPTEYAEVFLRQFNTYDVPLLVEGAVFYWSLGFRQKANGQILNVSEFILRRTPRLTRSQKSAIDGKVAKLRELLPNH